MEQPWWEKQTPYGAPIDYSQYTFKSQKLKATQENLP